ncbi:UBX domain-containing protein 1 isoform X3 [Oratosquilla oratoria]|uniref:UBX domain-containing protein 1 isoform X3 n=1 Tax=Oratosquilla oratoria TaxID=337810 RepID=UPI003F777166
MSALQTLIEMGFPQKRAEKALAITGGSIEQAMEWLLAHSDDPGVDEETTQATGEVSEGSIKAEEKTRVDGGQESEDKTEAGGSEEQQEETAKSIRCDDCGKLFNTPEEVEFHATKSGHSNFSESIEEKKPLSDEEKKEKVKELEEKLKARRQEKHEQEVSELRERERKRIQIGKEMAEAKRRMQEDEMKRIAEERRRDKLEDKLARQRVKEQIEKDREARKEKFGGGAAAAAVVPKPQIAQVPVQQAAAPKKDYSTTRLQIRLPTGPPQVQEFKAKEPLSAVRLWVSLNRKDGVGADAEFTLSTTFPRRIFSEDDMEKPLDVLNLVPSAVLIVANKT